MRPWEPQPVTDPTHLHLELRDDHFHLNEEGGEEDGREELIESEDGEHGGHGGVCHDRLVWECA